MLNEAKEDPGISVEELQTPYGSPASPYRVLAFCRAFRFWDAVGRVDDSDPRKVATDLV